jgi:hypothetical protein
MGEQTGMSLIERGLTEIEWRQIKAQRTAQTIIGGDPLVPYDLIGMANEIVSLRQRLAGAVAEAEKWKRIAQDRCTCAATCGDTPEESGGVCKQLPRAGQ